MTKYCITIEASSCFLVPGAAERLTSPPAQSDDGYYFTINLAVAADSEEQAKATACEALQQDETYISLLFNPLDVELTVTATDTFAETAPLDTFPLAVSRFQFRPSEQRHAKRKQPDSLLGALDTGAIKLCLNSSNKKWSNLPQITVPS